MPVQFSACWRKLHSTEVAFSLLTPVDPRRTQIFSAEIYRRPWLEELGQSLENVDQTHLVQTSGKQVLQKL